MTVENPEIPSGNLNIREALDTDALILADLSRQLGYPVNPADTLLYLQMIHGTTGGKIIVATSNERIIGWMGLQPMVHLTGGPVCEISGLIVDQGCRSRGVGALLLRYARDWARERGIFTVRVHCNRVRSGAHRFYTQNGLTEIKEQKVFEVQLTPG